MVLVQKELKNAYIGIPNPTSIVLDKSSITLTTIGQTEQLTATIEPTVSDHSITWSSDDTTVATVDTTGLVTCVTPGECTITATTVNGLTATCSVTQSIIPSAYQEVEYIQSSGEQLIDTGYLITPNTEVSADFQYSAIGGQPMVFGIGSDVNTNNGMTFCIYANSNRTFVAGISDGSTNSGSVNTWSNNGPSTDTNRHTFILNNGHFLTYNSSGILQKDETTSLTFTRTAEHSFGIFCWWRLDTSSWYNKSSGKLYGCTVKESGVLQRNFIPCYRKADSVIGLYDLVNDVFYTNSGTGTFTKGPDVN